MAFRERQLVMVLSDLAHFTTAVAGRSAVEVAEVVDRYYHDAHAAASDHAGQVVKFVGDSCLTVFPADAVLAAVDAVADLESRVATAAEALRLDLVLGVNMHRSVVAEGPFGPDKLYDIVGPGVIHTFRMGRGPGIRISEPVYRQLPNDRRANWSKYQAPATYTRTAS